MGTLEERMKRLEGVQLVVVRKLLEEIIVSIPVCYAHTINQEGQYVYDELGTIVFNRTCQNATLVAGILGYKNHVEVFNEIIKA